MNSLPEIIVSDYTQEHKLKSSFLTLVIAISLASITQIYRSTSALRIGKHHNICSNVYIQVDTPEKGKTTITICIHGCVLSMNRILRRLYLQVANWINNCRQRVVLYLRTQSLPLLFNVKFLLELERVAG